MSSVKRWVAITGSRRINIDVEQDIRGIVREILDRNEGVVTDDPLGISWFVIDEALKHDSKAAHILVCLPDSKEAYLAYCKVLLEKGEVTSGRVDSVEGLLKRLSVANPGAILGCTEASEENAVVMLADELVVFQANEDELPILSLAEKLEKPVQLMKRII